jgi:hypothetical protein
MPCATSYTAKIVDTPPPLRPYLWERSVTSSNHFLSNSGSPLQPGFLTICRRFINKGGVMLTPSLRGGSIPVFPFPPGCLDRGRNTGILSFDFAEAGWPSALPTFPNAVRNAG